MTEGGPNPYPDVQHMREQEGKEAVERTAALAELEFSGSPLQIDPILGPSPLREALQTLLVEETLAATRAKHTSLPAFKRWAREKNR